MRRRSTLYTPRTGNQNQVGAGILNGRLLATVLPQTLFLDLRASGSLQSASGLQGPSGTTSQLRSNTVQEYTVSISPYALHRFGPWGTGEVGATYGKVTQSALQDSPLNNGPVLNTGQTDPLLAGSSASQDTTSYGGHLAFTTGEAFGRYNGVALGYATYFDGQGVLANARRNIATVDSGYAVTRTVTALLKLGFEDIRYAGTSPLRIDDAVWDVGVRLLPNDQSTVTLRYGHHDGFDSLLVDAAYQPTARTRVYLRYSSGLSTQAEALQNALATSDVDSLGNPVDHATGAPLVGADNFFGAQNDLYKVTELSVTGSLLRDRDILTVNFNAQDRKLVSGSGLPQLAGFNQFGMFVDGLQPGQQQGAVRVAELGARPSAEPHGHLVRPVRRADRGRAAALDAAPGGGLGVAVLRADPDAVGHGAIQLHPDHRCRDRRRQQHGKPRAGRRAEIVLRGRQAHIRNLEGAVRQARGAAPGPRQGQGPLEPLI